MLDRSSDARAVYIGTHERMPCLTVYGSAYAEYLVGEIDRLRLQREESGADPDCSRTMSAACSA